MIVSAPRVTCNSAWSHGRGAIVARAIDRYDETVQPSGTARESRRTAGDAMDAQTRFDAVPPPSALSARRCAALLAGSAAGGAGRREARRDAILLGGSRRVHLQFRPAGRRAPLAVALSPTAPAATGRARRAGPNAKSDSGRATGTAFVVNGDGYLVTCAHVVHGGTAFQGQDRAKGEMPATVLEGRSQAQPGAAEGRRVGAARCCPSATRKRSSWPRRSEIIGFPLSGTLGDSIKVASGRVGRRGRARGGSGSSSSTPQSIPAIAAGRWSTTAAK